MAGRASNELMNRQKQEFDKDFNFVVKSREESKKKEEGRAENLARIAAKRELLKSRKNNKDPESELNTKIHNKKIII